MFIIKKIKTFNWYRKWKCKDCPELKEKSQVVNSDYRDFEILSRNRRHEIVIIGPPYGGLPGVGDSAPIFIWYGDDWVRWNVLLEPEKVLQLIGKGAKFPCRSRKKCSVQCTCMCDDKVCHSWNASYSEWIYGYLSWYELAGGVYCKTSRKDFSDFADNCHKRRHCSN